MHQKKTSALISTKFGDLIHDHDAPQASSSSSSTVLPEIPLSIHQKPLKRLQAPTILTVLFRMLTKFGKYSSFARKIIILVSVFQHWIFYVIMPRDPTYTYYCPSFRTAIYFLLAIENGFWTTSLMFPNIKHTGPIKWLRSICSSLISSYLSFDELMMSCISERLKVWFLSPGQLRASWEKTSTDPIVSFCHRFVNGISLSSVQMKEIKISNRTLLLFYRTDVRYETKRAILWIPGGGFHALGPNDFLGVGSYLSHRAPVLILDYPKSPENPYPEALFWIYNSIPLTLSHLMQEHHEIFIRNVNISSFIPWRIVIAGDSAGGNLATILATKIIQEPMPGLLIIGLALIYPLLSFEISGWLPQEDQEIRAKVAPHLVGGLASGGPFGSRFAVPSRLLNLNDKIIRTDILCYLAQSYLSIPKESIIGANRFMISHTCHPEEEINPSDPTLTPLKFSSHLIQSIPRLFIQVGEMDPFLDDSLIIFHKAIGSTPFDTKIRSESEITFKRLQGPSENISLSLVEEVSHGYLQMQLLWKGFNPCMLEILTAIGTMFNQDSSQHNTDNASSNGGHGPSSQNRPDSIPSLDPNPASEFSLKELAR